MGADEFAGRLEGDSSRALYALKTEKVEELVFCLTGPYLTRLAASEPYGKLSHARACTPETPLNSA